MYQWTHWLLVSAVAATALWIGGVLWIIATPGSDATAADQSATQLLDVELRALSMRVGELSSTTEWLDGREASLNGRIDELSEQLDAISARLDSAITTLEALTAPTAVPTPHPLSTNGQDLYNCASFGSWEEAQALFEANLPGDPNHIDTNGNGIACEDLRVR